MSGARRPRVLVVGGTGGFVGRAVRAELARDVRLRSLHRRPVPAESSEGIEWIAADVAGFDRWPEALRDVDAVLQLAWYRAGPARRFVALREGLERLLEAAVASGRPRFVQISVPPAPEPLERSFPYLVEKRRFDRRLAESGLPYRILRPTLLFGPGDVLFSVMMREMRRYGIFPMFGDGRYHVSPLAVADLARILRAELVGDRVGTSDLGGPVRYEYRELTDLLFRAAGRRPRYWHLSERGGIRLASLLERLGSRLLYAYEVEWLVADLLGLPAAEGVPGGLTRVERYLGLPEPSPASGGRGEAPVGPRV